MDTINGKILISTDWHCGIKANSVSRLNVFVNMIKEHIAAVKEHDVKALFMAGDLFHERASVNVNTINVALKCVQALAKHCKVYLICGNHDCFLKNSTDVNSLNMFRDTPNVMVVSKPEELVINNKSCLMVPWMSDLSGYKQESYDMLIGHFDISSKYLMQSYIEDNAAKRGASDGVLAKIGVKKRDQEESIGNFVDLAKRSGTVWAGHIHQPKDFTVKGRRFVFVGTPYQQTMGEAGCKCGFYVIDENWRDSFIETKNTPKHIRILMSEALAGNVDFSIVKQNIIQKIYDIDVEPTDEAVIQQKISDMKPYEELLPDYRVELKKTQVGDNAALDLIRKSKLEYVRNYIDNIDDKALDADGIDRDKLYSVLETYYNRIVG